jgi:DNA-binding XRE family transcriptional regulator
MLRITKITALGRENGIRKSDMEPVWHISMTICSHFDTGHCSLSKVFQIYTMIWELALLPSSGD